MSHPWIRRFCIAVVDFLFGSYLFVPLSKLLLKRGFTRTEASGWHESQIPNLHGRVAVVTGANAGIGYYTARQLALNGAKVYLACRSEVRARAAIEGLFKENPSIPQDNLVWLRLDLSSQAQVVDAARELRSKEQRLDILVNNAGIDPYDYVRTSDGFELTMAVNHIGHWTLTHCLLPLLTATAAEPSSDVRVITVSSSGHRFISPANDFASPKDLDDACTSPGWETSRVGQAKRYCTTKRANILFASELQRRFDEEDTDIISLSLNPGPVRTEGAAEVMPLMARPLVRLLFNTPDTGALTTLFAATDKEVKEDSKRWKGRYVDGPGKVGQPSPRAQDVIAARNLWTTTEAAVRAIGVLEGL